MLNRYPIEIQIKQIAEAIDKKVKKFHFTLNELKRLSTALFSEIKADESDIENWFKNRGFKIDEDGFWQSIPLLEDFRNNKAPEDAVSFSFPPKLLKNKDACFRMYCLRNIGTYLKEIKSELPSSAWIYYQDVTNTAVQFPFIDQITAITPDFEWSKYHTFISVEPKNNPKGIIKWTKPTIDYAGEGLILSVSIPVELKNKFVGLWSIDVSMSSLYPDILFDTILNGQINLIIDKKGFIIAHPLVEAIIDMEKGSIFQRSIKEVTPEFSNINIKTLLKKKSGMFSLKKNYNNEDIMVFFEVISGIEWIFISTFPKQSMEDDVNKRIMDALNHVKSGDFSFRLKEKFALEQAEIIAEGFNEMVSALENQEKLRNQANEEKEKLERRIHHLQRMEAIGTLAGGIAHDFNNILSPIIGYSEFLVEEIPKENPHNEIVLNIYQAASRASDLTKQILTFSRQAELKSQPVSLQNIINEALKLIRSSIPKDIKIFKNIDDDCPHVLADPTKLHQIIVNLCTNAFHAVQDNVGAFEINLEKVILQGKNEPDFAEMPPGIYARLTVSDNGCGMDDETIKRIFDPYFTTKQCGKGTGLGLSVSYGIVQNLGGDIKVYSERDKGSSFQVLLPSTDLNIEETDISDIEITGGNEKILFVDDEEIIAIMAKNILRKYGYDVTIFTESIKGLEHFKKNSNKFDIVITDMVIPEMNGEILAREIKKIRKDIPIILCTGFSEKLFMEKHNGSNIDDFLMKPMTIRKLLFKIRNLIDKK